jgi:Phage capsid family
MRMRTRTAGITSDTVAPERKPPQNPGFRLPLRACLQTNCKRAAVVGLGTALVGNFGQGAQIYRRGGVSVEATNSHSDWFAKDISMLRAEERLGLGVYRPAAFTAVSGLA